MTLCGTLSGLTHLFGQNVQGLWPKSKVSCKKLQFCGTEVTEFPQFERYFLFDIRPKSQRLLALSWLRQNSWLFVVFIIITSIIVAMLLLDCGLIFSLYHSQSWASNGLTLRLCVVCIWDFLFYFKMCFAVASVSGFASCSQIGFTCVSFSANGSRPYPGCCLLTASRTLSILLSLQLTSLLCTSPNHLSPTFSPKHPHCTSSPEPKQSNRSSPQKKKKKVWKNRSCFDMQCWI